MNQEQFSLFVILIKLKSYLISLLDNPDEGMEGFIYASEYLERRFPEQKNEILSLLEQNGIANDGDIAFDETAHLKFNEIVKNLDGEGALSKILREYEIDAAGLAKAEERIKEMHTERDEKIKELVKTLFQSIKVWTVRRELENHMEDYITLDEEEALRPEEKSQLEKLDKNVSISYESISNLSLKYLDQLIEYYFEYGGNLQLKSFVEELSDFKKKVDNKYDDLFRDSGLNK